MKEILLFLHLASAVVWLGGMTVLLVAVRPPVLAQLEGAPRVKLLAAVLQRFFVAVWASAATLLATGGTLYAQGASAAAAARRATVAAGGAWQGSLLPLGWNVMMGLGLLMMLLFAHLYFAHFKKLQRAVAAGDTPAAAFQLAKIHPLVLTNFALGWLAIAAIKLL